MKKFYLEYYGPKKETTNFTKKGGSNMRERKIYFSVAIIMFIYIVTLGRSYALDNVALNKAVKASDIYENYLPERAVDGDRETNWSSTDYGSIDIPRWLMADLGGIYDIERVDIYGVPFHDSGYTELNGNVYNLYYSLNSNAWDNNDASAWILKTSAAWFDKENEDWNTIPFNNRQVRYLKYEVIGGLHWAQLFEVEAYGAPTVTPEPVSLFLFGLGGLTLGFLRKRKKHSRYP